MNPTEERDYQLTRLAEEVWGAGRCTLLRFSPEAVGVLVDGEVALAVPVVHQVVDHARAWGALECALTFMVLGRQLSGPGPVDGPP